jgi:hypothetical protein
VTQLGSRQQRRKEQTRAALVRAAQALLAAGTTDVPSVKITQAAVPLDELVPEACHAMEQYASQRPGRWLPRSVAAPHPAPGKEPAGRRQIPLL